VVQSGGDRQAIDPDVSGELGRAGRVSIAAIGVFAALLFVALSLSHLDRFPPVHEDETYIAASAARLASGGPHGNPLFTGFHSAERHVFLYPPLLPVLQSLVFRATDVDVVSMRIPSVVAGLATTVLAGALAARTGGAAGGALAAALLVILAVAGGVNRTSGIPLLDSARIARYDILVPAFGLASLVALERAYESRRGAGALWFVSGVFAGLATIAHLYGAFWLVGIIAVLVARRSVDRVSTPRDGRCDRSAHGTVRTAAALIVAGFAMPLLPVVAKIAASWADFVGQQRVLAGRYDVLDPTFYVRNIINEPLRYGPLFGVDGNWTALALRPGLVVAGIGLALGLARWFRRDLRARDRTTFAVGSVLLTNVVMFAVFVQVKTYNYLISVWPLAVILIAATALDVWREAGSANRSALDTRPAATHASRTRRWRTPLHRSGPYWRLAVAAALALITVEGTLRITSWRASAAQTTPYVAFTRRVAAHIPPGSHVLGLQRYWLGLSEFRYTSWLVPVWWSDPRFTDTPVPLDEALERVAPDVILIDSDMGRYFDALTDAAHPDHERLLAWRRFAEGHGAALIATIDDPTYGTMQVWSLRI
jgi:4-amino-4-deoxy-L-arabinose transferase-like glycosyltransferase